MPGVGRASISTFADVLTNPPASGKTLFCYVTMTTLANQLKSQTAALASGQIPVTANPNIANNHAASTAAASNTLQVVNIPATIPSATGLVTVKVSYQAKQPAYIFVNVQQHGGSYTWFAGKSVAVPQGSGTLSIPIVLQNPISVPGPDPVAVQVYMATEANFLQHYSNPWEYPEPGTSIWTDVALSSSVQIAQAKFGQTASFDESGSSADGNMIPVWGIVVIVCVVIGVVVAAVIGVFVWRSLKREEMV